MIRKILILALLALSLSRQAEAASAKVETLTTNVNQTVTATHTFNPPSVGPPFTLGANAVDQLVSGLKTCSIPDLTTVTCFNAKGDGKTDDRAAIQAKIVANASLVIPGSGSYMIGNGGTGGVGLRIDADDVTIWCPNHAILKAVGSTNWNDGAIIRVGAVKNFKISGCILDGNKAGTATNVIGFRTVESTAPLFDNLEIRNFGGGAYGSSNYGGLFDGTPTTGHGTLGGVVQNSYFHDNDNLHWGSVHSYAAKFLNNKLTELATGVGGPNCDIDIEPNPGQLANGTIIFGNEIAGKSGATNTKGLCIVSNGGPVYGTTISANYIRDHTLAEIFENGLSLGAGVVITGNLIVPKFHGIIFYGSGEDHRATVVGNIIQSYGQNERSCILIYDATGITIQGNSFIACAQNGIFASADDYGTVGTDSISILNNQFSDISNQTNYSQAGPIFVQSNTTRPMTNFQIKGNLMRDSRTTTARGYAGVRVASVPAASLDTWILADNIMINLQYTYSGVAPNNQSQRTTTGSCAAGGCQVTVTWPHAYHNTNYTPVCSVADSTTQSETTGLRLAKINTVSAGSMTVDVDNYTGSGVTGELKCTARHDPLD